jgi:hypothetical protein
MLNDPFFTRHSTRQNKKPLITETNDQEDQQGKKKG